MKTHLIALVAVVLALQLSHVAAGTASHDPMQPTVIDSSDPLLNKTNLDRVKQHIIALGARCTYVNMYNNNPCWSLASYKFYLNPDPGPDGHPQWNINCDITRGDFNTLVVEEVNSDRNVSINFRPNAALTFRSSRYAISDSPSEMRQTQIMLRAAVTAALKAIDGD